MKSTAAVLGLAIFLAAISAVADGKLLHVRNGSAGLLELYTSEGCSSCPPADAWLNGLRKDSELWKKFVPVAFHVTYWDYIGWKDPYGQESYSQRQQAYSRGAGKQSVYTPELFVNGLERTRWVTEAPSPSRGSLEITEIAPKKFRIEYTPDTDPIDGSFEGGPFTLQSALLANGLSSRVTAGENSGSTLKHDFVAVKIFSTELNKSETPEAGKKKLSAVVDLTADSDRAKTASYSAAFWVLGSDKKPICAAGGDL